MWAAVARAAITQQRILRERVRARKRGERERGTERARARDSKRERARERERKVQVCRVSEYMHDIMREDYMYSDTILCRSYLFFWMYGMYGVRIYVSEYM